MNTNKSTNLLLLFFITNMFAACNKNQSLKSNSTSQWNNIDTWSFSGKMAINDGQNSGSGSISWQTNNHTTQAKFKAPLGHGSWTITQSQETAKLISSKNGETIADNATDLISRELGWEFPFNSLSYWVRGYQTKQALAGHNKLPITFDDKGWKITFQKWMKTPIGMLPKKIKASKGNYSVKLIVYKWNIVPR